MLSADLLGWGVGKEVYFAKGHGETLLQMGLTRLVFTSNTDGVTKEKHCLEDFTLSQIVRQ